MPHPDGHAKIIVAHELTQCGNDQGQLVPLIEAIENNLQNRRNRLRLETGRFCGDIRRPGSAFSVSEDTCSLSGLFLAPRLCIEKFRSRRLAFDGRYRSVT